uniref:Peptidase S1 domain-containing protein n=1 Tax=Amphilophus citrinellus TaxID=61819 RepID=A0A3Q0S307_AMPCI
MVLLNHLGAVPQSVKHDISSRGSDIINGYVAPKNSMLYMASVQDSHGHVCGGFLIRKDFVVTAAHCDDSKPTHVVLGTHNLTSHHQKISIAAKFKPESYEKVGLGDDIMLIKLSTEVQTDDKIQKIPLPPAEGNLKDKEVCQVAGWGLTETGAPASELRVVNVSVINPRVCQRQWPGLPASVICAGGYETDKGFCQGDSGGPLVCSGFAVGVVSFNKNSNCKYPDVPNVYTDVSKHLQWIEKIVGSKVN